MLQGECESIQGFRVEKATLVVQNMGLATTDSLAQKGKGKNRELNPKINVLTQRHNMLMWKTV